MSRRVEAVAIALLLVSLTPGARAEKADREKPVNLEADRLVVDDAKKISTYEGNVVLSQGSLLIRADKLTVRQDARGSYEATAYGNPAHFREKREGYDEFIEGYGQRIEYNDAAKRLELFGAARMTRGQDQVRGAYISYDANTEVFRVNGALAKSGGGRVRAVIQPRGKTRPAPPTTLKPDGALSGRP